MALPIFYNIRNLGVRRVSTSMTLLGISMVILSFCVIQALSQGMDAALASSGSEDTLLVLRPGSGAETNSQVTREAYRVISSLPGIAKDEAGNPICAAERYLTVYLKREGTEARTNIALRGTSQSAMSLRPSMRIVEGEFFKAGVNQIIVGRSAQRRFPQLQLNKTVHFEKRDWKVVGVFDAGGQIFESEIWGDIEDVGNAFKRDEFSSALVKARSLEARDALAKEIKDNQQIKLDGLVESKYYAEQFGTGLPLAAIGGIITVLLAIGATFGAMNTMYAAVSARTREIAVLRAIGFSKGSVLVAFLLESLLLALAGGVLGCALSLFFNGLQTGTMNWQTFTEIAFQFKVTPEILGKGMMFAAFLGLIGGLLPALRAARMTILQALRAV